MSLQESVSKISEILLLSQSYLPPSPALRLKSTGVVDKSNAPCRLTDADNDAITNDAILTTTRSLTQVETEEAKPASHPTNLQSLMPIYSFICPNANCRLSTHVNTNVTTGKFNTTTQQLLFNTNDGNDTNHPAYGP